MPPPMVVLTGDAYHGFAVQLAALGTLLLALKDGLFRWRLSHPPSSVSLDPSEGPPRLTKLSGRETRPRFPNELP
jgi:hypothetical protein